ncbi:MAG: sarcosine oxidase subunit gamma [Pseudomonadota bacterium]
MVKLTSKSAAQGRLPLTIGTVQVTEVVDVSLTALAPYQGKEQAAALALKSAHGLDWPGPNQTTGAGSHAIWFGLHHIMLAGMAPDAALSQTCAVTDQTDAWAVVDVVGPDAAAVLSRLTPVDLRDGAFAIGATARTDVQHMQGSVTRTADHAYRVMVFRSMAKTLVHDLKTAMDAVATLNA